MQDLNKESKYIRAKERVDELKKFYSHLWTYILVISGLALINYLSIGFEYMWFLWVAFGWGVGLVFQALGTFRLNPFFGKRWEEEKIKRLMADEEGETKKWK
ncbi:2TM domain-containing protein [Flagellimonas flava]|uniref:2TM domain-containing protein n=1 Tax=Flagellimonas flava TaxID=570519 RepID=A0A1M5I2X1_9FLAO|nr:2TM domain-containing protein [Allomuricauda flava]SHG22353.1 2TM domain-containing protein [Allomuricauda flava]